MNERVKFSGQMKSYMSWPLFLTAWMILVNVLVFAMDRRAGLALAGGIIVYIFIALGIRNNSRKAMFHQMIDFAAKSTQLQKALMDDLALPFALLDEEGRILWMDRRMRELTGKDENYHPSVNGLFSSISKEIFPKDPGTRKEVEIHYAGRYYRAELKNVDVSSVLRDADQVILEGDEPYCFIGLLLFDITELKTYIQKNQDDMLVSGLLYLDNFEEAAESMEEVRASLLAALIERKINRYFGRADGIVKKLEKDKYFLIMRRKSLSQLIDRKFGILEEIKEVNVGNEMAVTISMGIGTYGEKITQSAEQARIAIELALGRGGDQVVVKDGDVISYYGGQSPTVEKTTRVKARVKAHALKEFMSQKENVVIMGHKITDVDTFGAAIGIYRAARSLDKKAHIVVNTPTSSIRPLMDEFLNNQDYPTNMFVNSQEARDLTDDSTVLVVVDTNRRSYTECEDLLDMTKTIVVLDHHRLASDSIKTAVLSYVEPYASSACEMVAEILQYFSDSIRIRNIEADSIYAGIMIDTNNFLQKTGVRTFEAAAFLRRCGADVTRVRKMFREDAKNYRARGEAIRNAELFKDSFAISVCPSDNLDSPTVVGAQAANELLNIVGVKASFVLTDYDDTVFISARSIDEVNVQLVMERMGGGGHLNIAGAQLKNYTLEQASAYIKETLEKMLNEGDLL